MEQLNFQCKSESLLEHMDSFVSEINENFHDNQEEMCTKFCLFCSKHFNYKQYFNNTQLKTICQILKIDLEKVVKTKDDTELALCEECTSVASKLTSLFEQLETTQMWINHSLRTLMGILISGEGTNNLNQSRKDNEGGQILRELIMGKCNSTIKITTSPHLQLTRLQLPVTPIKQELEDDNIEEDAALSSDALPTSPLPLQDSIIKLEEIQPTFVDEDDIAPNSPLEPPPINNDDKPASSLHVQKEQFVSSVIKRKPFWFIKPTEEIAPQGKRRIKYNCPFCPKLMHGYSACKFHIIGKHPEHIFPFQQLAELTTKEFSSCCSTILEEEITPISNEDGKGSFTTFECKYCPPEEMTRKADKRVVQVHMIRCHYDELVSKLKCFQELHGSPEFEQKLAKYSEKPSFQKKVGKGGEFRRKWRCDECQCGFPNKKRLQVHIQLHGEGIKDAGEKIVKTSMENEASSTVPKASPCETCGKIFSCGYSLWRHKRLSCVKGGSLPNLVDSEPGNDIVMGEEQVEDQEYVGYNEYIAEEMDEEILSNELEKDPLS